MDNTAVFYTVNMGSIPVGRTKMRLWWNGIHSRLKICRLVHEGSNLSSRTMDI